MYAVDLPGHGKSRNHAYQSVAGYAENLLNWLDAVGLYRAVFVGYSLGGAVAIYLGSMHPERVAGLAIIASVGHEAIPHQVLEDVVNPSTYLKGLQHLISPYFCGKSSPSQSSTLLQKLAANRPSVVHSDLLACNHFDPNGKLALIQAPSLILCGENDQFSPLRRSQYLANAVAKAKLVVIPEAGHMLVLEQTQEIADALSVFLKTIPYLPGQG
jgi:pimeloyl-ACP methyl ester carboxylesterase